MKKFIVMSLLVTAFSLNTFADTQIFQCNFNLNKQSQILKNLSISLDVYNPVPAPIIPSYLATLAVRCDLCSTVPANFYISGKIAGLQANFEGPLNNTSLKLDVTLESFAPTTTHAAQLTHPSINDGKPLDGTCTDLR